MDEFIGFVKNWIKPFNYAFIWIIIPLLVVSFLYLVFNP